MSGIVVFDAEDVGLAANLTVLDVGLAAAGGFVHGRDVPFPAGSALEAGFHFFEDSTELSAAEMKSV